MLQINKAEKIAFRAATAVIKKVRVSRVELRPLVDQYGDEALNVCVVIARGIGINSVLKYTTKVRTQIADGLQEAGEGRSPFRNGSRRKNWKRMTMPNAEHLIQQAERPVGTGRPGPSRQVDIRRAASSAYYDFSTAFRLASPISPLVRRPARQVVTHSCTDVSIPAACGIFVTSFNGRGRPPSTSVPSRPAASAARSGNSPQQSSTFRRAAL